MKIEGHSNFKVELLQENGKFFVRKSANNKEDSSRLKKQYLKQFKFKSPFSNIITPKTFKFGGGDENFYFDMEYNAGLDFSELLEFSKVNNIDNILNYLLRWIDQNIISNIIQTGSFNEFRTKDITLDVKLKYFKLKPFINSNKTNLNKISKIFKNVNKVEVVVGKSHGDLTLSNMLFDNEKIVLIDFLDSFVETPLNDIVKLRQDTKYKWSVNLLKNKRDITKLNIILDRLDDKIDKFFSKYSFYREYYNLFQLLNLLRILPYTKDEKIKDFLYFNINNLLKEFK